MTEPKCPICDPYKCVIADPTLTLIYGCCPLCERKYQPELIHPKCPDCESYDTFAKSADGLKALCKEIAREELTAQAQEMGLYSNPIEEIMRLVKLKIPYDDWPDSLKIAGVSNDFLGKADYPFDPIPHIRIILLEFIEYYNHSSYFDGVIEAPEELLDAYLKERYSKHIKSHWVKCSEQMPSIGKICLLYQTYPEGTMFNCLAHPLPRCFIHIGGRRYDDVFVDYLEQYSEVGIKYVTHWMNLPDAPNE